MKFPGLLLRVEVIRNAFKILVGKLKGRDHSEDTDGDVKIIQKWP